jgi:hypothetical protein
VATPLITLLLCVRGKVLERYWELLTNSTYLSDGCQIDYPWEQLAEVLDKLLRHWQDDRPNTFFAITLKKLKFKIKIQRVVLKTVKGFSLNFALSDFST